MSFRTRAGGVLRWFLSAAKGTLYPLDATGEETALAVGTDGQVLTADSTTPGGMSWQDVTTASGEILIDDASGEILLDDASGDVLYEDGGSSGGTGGTGGTADLTTVLDTADATVYVATTGSDTTGDGSAVAPYATWAKVRSTLPRTIGFVQTVSIADGTYAEALVVEDIVCTGVGKLLISGNPTTPANVQFTGTVTRTRRGQSLSATVFLAGKVNVELEGIEVNATADHGVWATDGAIVTVDRATVTGTLGKGIVAWLHSHISFEGNVTVSGFSLRGVAIQFSSSADYAVAGTLTVTGASTTTAWGIQVTSHSEFAILSQNVSGIHITISGVKIGFQLGLASIFTHQAASATISVTNASTPSSSAAVQVTDCSSWSANGTSKTVALDHFTTGFDLNSISYAEAVGTRTYTNLGSTSVVTQNSVYFEA